MQHVNNNASREWPIDIPKGITTDQPKSIDVALLMPTLVEILYRILQDFLGSYKILQDPVSSHRILPRIKLSMFYRNKDPVQDPVKSFRSCLRLFGILFRIP